MSDDKTLGIQVQMTIDDVISGLNELIDLINNIPDKIININLGGDAQTEAEDLNNILDEIAGSDNIARVDFEGDALEQATTLKEDVDTLNGTDANITINDDGDAKEDVPRLSDELDAVNGEDVVIHLNDDGSLSDDLQTDTDEMGDLTSNTNDFAVAAATAAGATATYSAAMGSLDYSKNIQDAQIWASATQDQTNARGAAINAESNAEYQANALSGDMAYLAGMTGNSSDAIKYFNGEMELVKDSGMDAKTGIYDLTEAYRLYGISADDAAKYNGVLFTEWKQSGIPTMESFTSILDKAGAQLANMGFTLSDTGALIDAFGKSGLTSPQITMALRGGFTQFTKDFDESNSKLGDYEKKIQAVGVATRDASGNLRPAKDVLSDLLVAFSKMPYSAQKSQEAIAIFGTSGGKSIANLKYNYKDLEDQANQTGDTQVEQTTKVDQATQHTAGSFQNWVQTELSGLGELASKYGGTVAQIILYLAALDRLTGKNLENFGEKVSVKIAEGIKDSRFVEAIESKIDELKNSNVFNKIFGSDGEPSIEETESKVGSFVTDTKGKLKDLEHSNVWSTLFGEEKGSVNLNVMDDLLSKITAKLSSFKQVGGSLIDNFKAGIDEKLPTLDGEGGTISDRILAGLNSKLPTFKTEGQQIVASINEGIESAKVETPSTGTVGGKFSLTEGSTSSTGSTFKLPDGNEILPPKSETTQGKENVGWLGDSEGLGGIVDKLKTWTTIPKFNAASLGRGVLSVLGDAEMLPMMAGTTLADMNPVKHNLTPEEQADVDARNKAAIDPSSTNKTTLRKQVNTAVDEPSLQDQLGALFPKTSSDAIVKPYQDAIDKIKQLKMPTLDTIKLPSLSSIESGIGTEFNNLKSYITSHLPKMPDLGTIKLPSLSSIESGIESEFNGLKSYITSHLPKIPNINWSTLGTGLSGIVTTAEKDYGGLKDYVVSHIPKVPIPTWSNVSQGLGGIVSTAGKDYGGLKDYVISHIPQIPFPSWGNISSGLGGAVKTVEDDLGGLETFVKGIPGQIYGWAHQIGEGFANGLNSAHADIDNALNWIKQRTETHSPPIAGPLSSVSAEGWNNFGSSLIQNFSSGISSNLGSLNNSLSSAVSIVDSKFNEITNSSTDFLGDLDSVSSGLFQVGDSMMSNLVSGISNGLPELDSVFNEISGMFPHSPPKSGPLSTITTANMKSWAASVADAGVEGFSKLNEYANSKIQIPNVPNIPNMQASPISGSNQSGQTVIYLEVAEGAVVIQGNATDDTIKKAGSTLGTSLAGKLSQQANTAGVSVVNAMR